MENRQKLEEVLQEFEESYQIEKDTEIVVSEKSAISPGKETYHGTNGDISVEWEKEDIDIDYVISSKSNPDRKIFLMYKDDAASLSDVIDMEYLKRVEFPTKNKHDYMVFCGGPSDEVNEQLASTLGVHYYKKFDNLKNGLRNLLLK